MSLQQLNQCTFKVGGSYTNIVNLNMVTHSCYERGNRTSRKTAKLTPSESISNLLLEAERLQQTAKDLSHQLRLTTSSQIEYNDLVTTLGEIADETIPSIFCISLDNYPRDVRCQYHVLIEIAYMQGLLDEFVKKRTAEHNDTIQGLARIIAVDAIVNILWSYFERLFYSQYPVAKICESLCASRDRVYLALFKPMVSSLGKRVRGHQIDVDDFFGAQWSLPQDLCLNRQVFFSILRFKFQGGPAEMVVASEQFGIFRQDGLKAIQASDWESVIKEGDGLQLTVLVTRQFEDMAENPDVLECPQCRQSDKTIPGDSLDGWANCLRCNSNFNLTPVDSEDDDGKDSGDGAPASYESLTFSSIECSKHSLTFRCFSVTIFRKKSQRASPHPVKGSPHWSGESDSYCPDLAQFGDESLGSFSDDIPGFGGVSTKSFASLLPASPASSTGYSPLLGSFPDFSISPSLPSFSELSSDPEPSGSTSLVRRHSHSMSQDRGLDQLRLASFCELSSDPEPSGSTSLVRRFTHSMSQDRGLDHLRLTNQQLPLRRARNISVVRSRSPYDQHNGLTEFFVPAPPSLEPEISNFTPKILITTASDESDESSPTPPGRCQGHTIASTAILRSSKKQRTAKANFECHVCGKCLTSKDNLNNHIDAHNNVRRHECNHCGDRFRTRSVLSRHQNSNKCKSRVKLGASNSRQRRAPS